MTVSLHQAYMWKKENIHNRKGSKMGFWAAKQFSQKPETLKAIGLVKLFAYNYTSINKLNCKIIDDWKEKWCYQASCWKNL